MSLVKFKSIAKAVTAAGTAEPAVASSTLARSINIQAEPSNTGDIYIGASDVDASNGIVLEPGQTIEMEPPTDMGGMHLDMDLNELYIDAETSGDEVRIIYFYRG